MRGSLLFGSFACLVLAGCASRPDEASIFVQTAPPGAECTLSRAGQPVATVAPTPGIAVLSPAPDDVSIDCRRSGFREASIVVHARHVSPEVGEVLTGSTGHYEYEAPPVLTLAPQ
jgi:hypothetical protein